MLRNLLKWARVTKAAVAGEQYQTQQVTYLGKVADAAILQPYGLHANLPPDVLTLIVSNQGQADNRVALGCLLKQRPDLNEGEVAFYHPLIPDLIIKLEADGAMLIKSNNKINIEAPETEFTGVVKANGKVIDDTHSHTQGNDSDGNSQATISGVT